MGRFSKDRFLQKGIACTISKMKGKNYQDYKTRSQNHRILSFKIIFTMLQCARSQQRPTHQVQIGGGVQKLKVKSSIELLFCVKKRRRSDSCWASKSQFSLSGSKTKDFKMVLRQAFRDTFYFTYVYFKYLYWNPATSGLVLGKL